MENNLLIDTFDIIKVGRPEANHFDPEQFIEGILFYDKVLFSVSHQTIGVVIKQLVDMVGVELYKKLLDRKIIDFVIDDVGYALGEKGSSHNMELGRFEIRLLEESDKDIEKNIRDEVNSRSIARPSINYLKKSGQLISLQNIKGPAYQGNIAATLMNAELVKDIWKGYFPFSIYYSDEIYHSYKIDFDNGLIKIVTGLEGEQGVQLFTSLATVGLSALRAEAFKFIASNAQCNNFSSSLSTSTILSNQFFDLNKTHSNIMNIYELDNIPNLITFNLKFEQILKIRKETKHIRTLLKNLNEFDQEKFKAEYLNYFEKKHFYLDDKYSKVLRFVIPTAIGLHHTPTGIIVSASENILSNILEQKKSAKLRTIFKRNNLIE